MTPSRRCATWARAAATELTGAGRALLDLLVPAACAACGRPGWALLCPDCQPLCQPPPGPACLRCGSGYHGRDGCGRCRRFGRPFAFAGAAGLWRYAGAVRAVVHAAKYHGRRDVLSPLGGLMAASPRLAALARPDRPLVVAVAARREALRRRGYDQARLLAERFAAELGLSFEPAALVRRRGGGRQAGRTQAIRRRQARGSFRARAPLVAGRPVVLVDDVLSTGATADAAARALRLAGATCVRVAVLAT